MDSEKFSENYFLKFNNEKSSMEWRIFYEKQISEIQKYIRTKSIKICDIGCGLGAFLEICDNFGWLTYGIDISEYVIRNARKRTNAIMILSDVQEEIPFDDKFDVLTCFDVIEHLKNPEIALSNMYAKLEKSGILLLTTPNIRSGFYNKISGWKNDDTHISLKAPDKWKKILNEAGFRVAYIRTGFPILEHKGGMKSLVGKMLANMNLGSTLYILALK